MYQYKKIMVLNRNTVQGEKGIDHIVISMSDDESKFVHIPEKNCLGILRIAVWDWDGNHLNSLFLNDEYGESKPVPENKIYNPEHGRSVLDFTFKFLDKVELIISQCDAGMCRSPATAAALSKIINGDDEVYFKPPFYPNRLIYRIILNEYIKDKDNYRTKYNLNFPDYFK